MSIYISGGVSLKWMCSAFLFSWLFVAGLSTISFGQQARNYPPMTHEQEGKVRRLVTRVQAEQAKIKAKLSAEQEELSLCYCSFEMDQAKIEAKHKAIADLGQTLLKTHLEMHKELRLIVGPEIFAGISKRLQAIMEKQLPVISKGDSGK